MKKNKNILEVLRDIRDIKKDTTQIQSIQNDDKISVLDIISALHAKSFAILIFLFCLPLTVPIPVPPGYTTLFSVPIIFLSTQMILGREYPWLPKLISRVQLKRSILAYLVEKSSPFLSKIENFSRARILFFSSKTGEKLYALVCLLCSIAIALPLPFTNMIPAVGLVIYSIAIINRDGLLSIIAMAVCTAGIVITTLVIILGSKFVQLMFSIGN